MTGKPAACSHYKTNWAEPSHSKFRSNWHPPTAVARPIKMLPIPRLTSFTSKGRFYLNQTTFPEIDRSAEYFQRSLEKDPSFALAYAGLADSHLANSIRSPQTFYPRGQGGGFQSVS